MTFDSIETLQDALIAQGYVAERSLVTAVYLSMKLGKPLFLEGEPGVGKTEIAKVIASMLDSDLIRLQCYEGLDVSQAVYEWNYTRQIMHIRTMEAQNRGFDEDELFGEKFLLRRPLLRAIEESNEKSQVLLIDEVDRSDEEFEAFLLEILS
ncbi:MAG: MoxR family ATPase, partial [Chloroflexota bacterium]